MSGKINITVDGRKVETENRVMLLQVLNDLGIHIPQLCNHPSLTPSGACRLCVVEITKKEWNGNSKIVTSCLYPAEDNLIISTRSEKVLETRRSLLELYLAQCPASEEVKALARLEGIDSTPFVTGEEDNKCVLCGLCARICQDCGPGAIATLGRGAEKYVGPNPAGIADSCTGCRACSYICPTGAIPLIQEDQSLTIWNRSFEIATCSVRTDICRGCGICEEVCPYSIPRVTMTKNGLPTAQISAAACVGCGICAGSCPTGAIEQKKTDALSDLSLTLFNRDLRGRNIVFSCPRSPMPDDNSDVVRVSCIGNVDISLLLYSIAAGAQSVALMCRDRLSCPYHQGGDLGEKRLVAADELLNYCGIGSGQLTLLQPYPGREGPLKVWQEYIETVKDEPVLLEQVYTSVKKPAPGMDLALEIIGWLKEQPGLSPVLPSPIRSLFKNLPDPASAVLHLERLPELHLLLSLTIEEPVVLDLLKKTAKFLEENNISVRPVSTEKELSEDRVSKIITFTPSPREELPNHPELITVNELAGVSSGNGGEKFTFTLDPEKRNKLLNNYLDSREQPLLCTTPEMFLQYALLLRPGSWQQSLAEKPELLFSAGRDSNKANGPENGEMRRITTHPILPAKAGSEVTYTFNNKNYTAIEGEVITSALYAAGVTVFGHHHRDGGAQGIYCVNGQCSQCMVIADGKPVKGCMTPVKQGMVIESVEGPPALKDVALPEIINPHPEEIDIDVLIIGGGPAGISAAIELGNVGVEVILIDDKQDLGGKLSLQTHNFFGSVADCYAGYRGVHIGHILSADLERLPTVDIWLNSTVVGVYSDGKFGVSGNGTYKLIKAGHVLFSTGAREKSLAFPGADLAGVYGAGAFQTLVNRDLVRCAERLFIIGGGNVGLIGAYHALQAGIDVVGLVEALPRCGGYKVHEDKIKRLGVPVWTAHTVLRIEGKDNVERVVVAAVDDKFQPVEGTERSFDVDTVLMAVGLSPVDELLIKAREYGINAYAAGDAEEIAEASAAIFSGRIIGRKIARGLGIDLPVPSDWEGFGAMLKHRPGECEPFVTEDLDQPVYPVIRCMQEIPCDPCTEACPGKCISMADSILSLPEYEGGCIGCGQCVLACPGLAITLVVNDYDPDQEKSLLIMPYEFVNDLIPLGREVTTTDMEGHVVGKGRVIAYRDRKVQNSRRLLLLEVPYEHKLKVAGFRLRDPDQGQPAGAAAVEEDPIICRCERVRKSEIIRAIRAGVRDMNQLKAAVRTGLGGCNGKTCTDLILRLYRDEGVPLSEITMPTHRPLVAEVHLGDFITQETEEN